MKPALAISMGDPAGIGPEITLKALTHMELYDICLPVVIGDFEAIDAANRFSNTGLAINEIPDLTRAIGKPGTVDLINPGYLNKGDWNCGEISELCGKASFEYIRRGIELALSNQVQGVVTGPISKEAINRAGYKYSGHTEIFAEMTKTKEYGMLLISGNLRTIHVTTHFSLRKACELITKERVLSAIRLADMAIKALGIHHPRIAVSGLNPHAGENGLFGDEEIYSIKPAVDIAVAEGIDAVGPLPPDTVFVKAMNGMYDVVVAMYHDQGHIPLKLSGFRLGADAASVSGVNCTVGLPIIRSSVDHGTAFDIAGKGIAHEGSMVDAINIGVVMAIAKFG